MACTDCNENSTVVPKGDPGTPGIAGNDGTNGSSFLSGSGVPSSGLGSNGDTYLNIDTYDLYSKIAGAWSVIGNIKGQDGTGLVKLAITLNNPTINTGGYISFSLSAAFLAGYGFPSVGPLLTAPPAGQTYGTTPTDYIVAVYELTLLNSNNWTKIPETRYSLFTTNIPSGGTLNINIAGAVSGTRYRFVLIG